MALLRHSIDFAREVLPSRIFFPSWRISLLSLHCAPVSPQRSHQRVTGSYQIRMCGSRSPSFSMYRKLLRHDIPENEQQRAERKTAYWLPRSTWTTKSKVLLGCFIMLSSLIYLSALLVAPRILPESFPPTRKPFNFSWFGSRLSVRSLRPDHSSKNPNQIREERHLCVSSVPRKQFCLGYFDAKSVLVALLCALWDLLR